LERFHDFYSLLAQTFGTSHSSRSPCVSRDGPKLARRYVYGIYNRISHYKINWSG